MTKKIQRIYPPGSEWLYFKIYGSPSACERVFLRTIRPVLLYRSNALSIDQWFFIRYADPDYHLRLRLKLRTSDNIGLILSIIHSRLDKFIKSGVIHRLVIDTYCREIERYGEQLIELTESIFYLDSVCISKILFLTPESRFRELFCYYLIDSFLDALGYDTYQKLDLTLSIAQSYNNEFGINDRDKNLNRKYRAVRSDLTVYIETTQKLPVEIIKICSSRNRRIAKLALAQKEKLNIPAILHMMMNRWFPINGRIREAIIYNFLTRYYKSQLAKTNNIQSNKS